MLQFITHETPRFSTLESAKAALEGGCKWIQLRRKEAAADELKGIAAELKSLCQTYGATFIIDDHVLLAKECGADGVHLGKTDMAPAEARRVLGGGFIIGGTANTFEDIERLCGEGVDYVGLGPFRFTETKKNLSPLLGLEGYRKIAALCRENNIHIPIVAIGGIGRDDIPGILDAGITGIALSGTILRAGDPVEETKNIIKILNEHRDE